MRMAPSGGFFYIFVCGPKNDLTNITIMKLNLISLLMLFSLSAASAQTQLTDWQDPGLVERNRYPMTASFETDGQKLSLNGVWDFKWYEQMENRSLDFYKMEYDAQG